MPLQIPATSFVMFAHLMGTGTIAATDGWQIIDRDIRQEVATVSVARQIESAESCLAFARAEAARMALGDSYQRSGGAVTFLQYADGVSFSCTQIEPAAALVAVSGPESMLRSNGYSFKTDR